MPSSNITGLTALATMQPSMLLYAALSPFGATDDRKITASALLTTITPLAAGVQAVTVTANAVPTVPTASIKNSASTTLIEFDPSLTNLTQTFDALSLSTTGAQDIGVGVWANHDAGSGSQFYAYAGTAGTIYGRLRTTAGGAAGTNLFDQSASVTLTASSAATGGLILIADTTAPIIFATGGHALTNERGRFDANGLRLGVPSSVTAKLTLAVSGDADTQSFQAADNPAATNTFKWPAADPGAGQVLTGAAPVAGVVTMTWTTPSGSGNTTSQGTFAGRPAASTAGNLYFSTDGFVISRDTGAAYSQWGATYLFTQPIDGDFAWVNQGSATTTSAGGAVVLNDPAGSTGVQVRKKTAPATPYTIDLIFSCPLTFTNSADAGFCWRQSSDGKIVTFEIAAAAGGISLDVLKFNSATSFNSFYIQTLIGSCFGFLFFLRAQDNGTNRICSFSADGQNWIQYHSVGRTDFMTADEIGYFVSSSASFATTMTLLSWKQS